MAEPLATVAEPLATVADIVASGHPVNDPDTEAHLEHLLRLGSALLRLRFSTLDARVAAGTLDASLVVDVLVAMVLRVPTVANPGGVRSESVSDDSYSVTYDSAVREAARVGLEFSAQEWALLAPAGEPAAPIFGSARLRAMLS